MKTTHQKKQGDDKNTIGTVVTGVAGAVAIAGVAVAATMALRDKKSRKKVRDMLIDVKDEAIDYIDTLKTDPRVEEAISAVKKTVTDTKKS